MKFVNDDGYEEEIFHGDVVFNFDNCEANSSNFEGSSMPLTALRLPTEEGDNENENEKAG